MRSAGHEHPPPGDRGPGDRGPGDRACDRCLARSWLLAALAGHLENARGRIGSVLALPDAELIAAIGAARAGELARGLERFDGAGARERARAAGLEVICRCDPGYPRALRGLESPPAVLYVAGGAERFIAQAGLDPVAIVGARRASPYGVEVARSLGRELACAGITVVSGMALGVDSAAHEGSLAVEGPTIAVLPASPNRAYPAANRALHRRILRVGSAISELPPGAAVWRWMFPARNRIIAGLSAMTVVVEAGKGSGALLTAGFARSLGRSVGAVPGRVTSPLSAGPNGLLGRGALLVRGGQDVLDCLFGVGARSAAPARQVPPRRELRALLAAIADGHDTAAALARAGVAPDSGLAALAELELAGFIRREAGGRFAVVPWAAGDTAG